MALLDETGAANVGGIMTPGQHACEHAVAAAMSSPLGVGAERFHTGGAAGPGGDRLPRARSGATPLERQGGYDEEFIRAQDWELNFRIRAAGGLIWFSPEPQASTTGPGPACGPSPGSTTTTAGGGASSPATTRALNLRYLAPPMTLVACVAGTAAAVVGATGQRWMLAGAALPGGYLILVTAGSAVVGRGMPARARAWLPVVLATMHLTWGAGFLRGAPGGSRSGPGPRTVYPGSARAANTAPAGETPMRTER